MTDQNKEKPPQEDESSEDEITNVLPEEGADEGEFKKIQELEARLKEMEDKYLRAYADFENYRKRVVKEKEEVAVMTSGKLLVELLEVKDHLELALSHSSVAEADVKALKEGVSLTLKQLQKFLEKFRVEEIDPQGVSFNPEFHEAIAQEATDKTTPGTIVHVHQKGYLFHGRLLRPARVTVASEKK